ncbi:MAG: lipopolysaccharide biosynthesis protein [Gammaproteobacteria bacterium]|nr:lipopolysaccharide biosynthesis protein [Gammaproteobacteria bacterium]
MDVRGRVLTAIKWTAAARFLGQIIAWVITIYVIRILSPADYGLMAMAIVVNGFLYLINDVGLDAVLIQKRELKEHEIRRVFGVVIAINLLFAVLVFAAAPLLADFFNEPLLVNMVRVLSLQFLFLAFETLPQAKLEREIDFKDRSIVDFVTLLFGSVTTLVLALYGFGVWSLVYGHLANIATRTIGLNIIAPCLCWPNFSVRGMGKMLSFGGFVTIDRSLWFVFAESDKFIGGKILGKELLGVYAVANHLASLPINKIAGLINSVTFPAFSRLQTEPKKIGDYLLKGINIMSIVAFPVFLGIACTSYELVSILLGEKWIDAALPLLILGLVMPLRLLSTLLPPVLWGVGRPEVSASNFLVAAMVMPIAFIVGAQYGVFGLALSWLLVYPVVFAVQLLRTLKVIQLSFGEVLKAISNAGFAALGMFGSVLLMKDYVYGESGELLHLLQLIILGASVYTLILISIDRQVIKNTLQLVRS